MQGVNLWAPALPHHRWAAVLTLDTLFSHSFPSLHPFDVPLLPVFSPPDVNIAPFILGYVHRVPL